MMSNKRHASTPVVVAKGELKKQTETKGYPLQNKNNRIISTYLKRLTDTTDW